MPASNHTEGGRGRQERSKRCLRPVELGYLGEGRRTETMTPTIVRACRGILAGIGIALCVTTAALPQGTTNHGAETSAPEGVKTGLEVFLSHPPAVAAGKRIGLITNPTGVDRALHSTIDLLATRTAGQFPAARPHHSTVPPL